MGNHFVPKFYLHGFTYQGRLWAHDKDTKKSFVTQPKSVANETGMYPPELESYFTESIEQPAQHAIEQIRLKEPLSQADKTALAHYIVAIWKRVPAGRRKSAERLPGVANNIERELLEQIDNIAAINPYLREIAEDKKLLITSIIRRNVEERSIDLWHQTLSSESTPRIVTSMTSMNWQFLIAKEKCYLTSDNPLFYFSNEGIASEKADVTIPFSSEIALWMNRDPRQKPLYKVAREWTIKEINRRTASNATRFVFSATNEAWISKLAFKSKYQLNHIPW